MEPSVFNWYEQTRRLFNSLFYFLTLWMEFPLVRPVFLNIYTLRHTVMILNYLFMITVTISLSNDIVAIVSLLQIRWLSDKQYMTSDNIQNLTTDITMHLLHILEQYIRGYLTGVNTNRWQKHVLADTKYELIYTIFLSFLLYNSFYLWLIFNHTASLYLKQKETFLR